MEILGDAPEALSNEQIMRRYEGALSQLVKSALDSQFESERQILVNQARLAWQFVKGNHFSVPGNVGSDYGDIVDYVPFDSGTNETGPDVRLTPPLNLIGGDLYKFMAVMGQNAPRVKAVSDDPQDPDSIECAHNADVNVRDLWTKCKVDRKWKALAFHLYVTGPGFIRGVWNTDAKKYGQTEEPIIEIQIDESGMPVPVQTGSRSYANGDAEMNIYSVLDVAIPYDAVELENNPLRLERMRSKWSLLAAYGGEDSPLEQYRDGEVPDDDYGTSSSSASEAKDAVSNPSGTGRARKSGQWRHAEYWIPTYMFESISNKETRKILKTQFPRGLYIARVGSVTVEIDNRAVEDEWAVCRVGREERIMDRPLSADSIPIQRALDDMLGMALETVLRAITQTIVDSQLLDRQAINSKEALPSEIILTAMPFDGNITNRIYQIPPARLGDQVLPLMQAMRGFMQEISGIRPELSGGGQPTQTYREAKQRRDQALMQLAPQADSMRFASEEIAQVLVKLRAKFGSGTVKATRQGAYGTETDVADMAQLKEDGWHAEANDDFPMTMSDRRDAAFSLLKEFSPEVQQALSILDPLNIEEILELIQIPGFESAIKDQKEKTLVDINRLLNEQPMPGQPGPDGQPGPPQASQPPDPYDNHPVAASVCARWMVSKTGQKMRLSNPAGFANVQAFWQAHSSLATPPPPPPPPPIKGNLSLSAKLEDYPNLIPEVFEGAGLAAPPPQTPLPQIPAGPGNLGQPGQAGDTSAPQEAPLPPLQNGPAVPQPIVQ